MPLHTNGSTNKPEMLPINVWVYTGRYCVVCAPLAVGSSGLWRRDRPRQKPHKSFLGFMTMARSDGALVRPDFQFSTRPVTKGSD